MSGLPPARRGTPLGEHVYSGPKHFTVAQERLGSAQPRPSIEPPRTLARSHLGDETLMRVVCTTCCYRGLNRDELTETLDGAPRSPGLLEHPSGGGQGCRHLARLQHGCQFDEEGAPGSFLGQLCGHLHGQADLTRPPPAPVTVTRRQDRTSEPTSACSVPRPTKLLGYVGRLLVSSIT